MSASVVHEREANVATLTLNRAASLNSLDLDTVDALIAAARRAVDEGAAALVLTGSGRAFCSGADLSGALEHRDAGGGIDIGAPLRSHYNTLVRTLTALPVPLVVAVNGIAAGGGASLALCGDIVIAARSASFRQTFVDIGLIPDMGATWRMPRLAGRARARGMALLGQALPAERACEWGLIWEVVDDDQLRSRAMEIATRLAGLSPAALRATREALDAGERNTLEAQLDHEAGVQERLGREETFVRAVTAFLSRRGSKGK